MQKHYNYLDIDLDSKNYRKLRAMQGDIKSRYILVNLYSNNLAYDLSHCTVKIYGLKRDKTIFFNNAVVKNAKLGQFEIELTNQALAVSGELKVQILVLGTDGEKLTSSAFFIDVGESIIDENAIESTNEFGALTESLTKVNEWNGYFEETSGKIEEKYTERLNNVDSQLEHKANQTDLEVQAKRIDSFTKLAEGSTTGDAELIDLRIGSDGKTYSNAGTSVREQIKNIKNGVSIENKAITLEKLEGELSNFFIKETDITSSDFMIGKTTDESGNIIDANGKFLCSGYIRPLKNTLKFTFSDNLKYIRYRITYYDKNKNFIEANETNWELYNKQITLKDNGFVYIVIALLSCSDSTGVGTAQYWNTISGGYSFNFSINKISNNIDTPSGVLTVAKNNAMYSKIQDAVIDNTGETISVYPGEYLEQINTADNTNGNKSSIKSIVGIDKTKCKVINHNDAYGKDTLWVSKGYFANMSFISDTQGIEGATTCAYALHIDNNWMTNSEALFENCYFYSEKRAAAGIGTRPNGKIIFRNCIFESDNITNSGAVFFHNSNDENNLGGKQELIFENCEFRVKNGVALYIQRVRDDNNNLYLTMNRCVLFSEEKGVTDIVYVDDSLYTGTSGNNIIISKKTFGNNIDISTYL